MIISQGHYIYIGCAIGVFARNGNPGIGMMEKTAATEMGSTIPIPKELGLSPPVKATEAASNMLIDRIQAKVAILDAL